jgi:hypothetical protein
MGADADIAVLEEVEFHVVVNGAAEVGLEAEETVAGGADGLAAAGEDDGVLLCAGPVLADHFRAYTCGVSEEEAVEFVAAEAVRGFGQRMADNARAEVKSHRSQDGRAECQEGRPAARAAEEREDGRRKEFAADLVPRESRLFRDPRRGTLTHGSECGHHARRASAHHMDSPHERTS